MKTPKTKFQPATSRPLYDGVGHEYRFSNGLTASVIQHQYSYGGQNGLWEMLASDSDQPLGWLTDQELETELDNLARKTP
ncbi:hypothetical protein [Timonella senegalensis]|uniref:hypothetical protein n=1 Tax=Timonella senegalensis TaxID=1465825 RepID=UPI0028A9D02E|nr:hypothetical protein [Timonella senegalensis]